MVPPANKPIFCVLIMLTMVILACQLPQDIASTPTSLPITPVGEQTSAATAPASPEARSASATARPTSLPEVPEHRISTHRIYGIAGFYDQDNSKTFIPRGANYSILVPVLDHYEDRLLGVGVYDHNRTLADFNKLSAAGYNTVRIVLDGCTSGSGCIGLEDGAGLNPAYLDNLVDLMKVAKECNLFLLLASNGLPELGGYLALADQGSNQSFAAGPNAEILSAAGIEARQKYWTDLLSGLIARQAPFDVVLGWEMLAEQYYQSDLPPFSLESGKVTAANGKSYKVSDEDQKQAMAVDGIRYYIEQVRQTILNYDPTALVSMGFFAPDSPNPWREGDERLVITAPLFEDSALDFFDLHAYPGMGLSMAELAENFGLGGHITKPILMGEVGANTWIYPDNSEAAITIQDWIAASCSVGFSGWLYSGYYPSPAGLADATWGMVDEQNTILNALAPNAQADACNTTVLLGRNLALGKTVTVSGALPDQPQRQAVDGDPNTQWSSGAYPPQWIEIDLGALYAIGEIRLTVGQWPAGDTVHQIWVGRTQDSMQLVQEFKGHEYDYDVLNYVPTTPLQNIRFVRVDTSESPSWVSWREIEVLAPFPGAQTATPEATLTPTP